MAWAKGAKLEVTISSTLTEVAKLQNITFMDLSVDEIDTSAHDSTDNYREFEPGWIDPGSISVDGIFTGATSQMAIKTLMEAGEAVAMKITAASGKTNSFNGFFTSLTVDLPHEDNETFSATIKVTGKPTVA